MFNRLFVRGNEILKGQVRPEGYLCAAFWACQGR